VAQRRKSAFDISYVTITYRSVFMGALGVLALAALVMFFAFPDTSNRVVLTTQASVGKLLAKVGISGSASANPNTEPGPQQAHFTNIDGVVRVKKARTNTWLVADYSLALERDDVVQTSSEGIARIAFSDGTNYTVKPGGLIVIQENSLNASQQTRVAVQVNSGVVDMATANTMARGSESAVIVAGATGKIDPESQVTASADPRSDQNEILLRRGSGQIVRGSESVKLASSEKVTFKGDDTRPMQKSKEIAPPILIEPPNLRPVYTPPGTKGVNFSWSEVEGAHSYRIKIARTPYFAQPVVINKLTNFSQVLVSDLQEGQYFWKVQSVDENGKESADSETYRFSVVPRAQDKAEILLELDNFRQMGHVIEVRGRTEPSARVMVNGQEVALINADGTFHHFTNQLPTGENFITITAQNAEGRASTKTKMVDIK
jgi:hypothetical protein